MLAARDVWRKYYLSLPKEVNHFFEDVLLGQWLLRHGNDPWKAHFERLAAGTAVELGTIGERADDGERSGTYSDVHCKESTVWKRGVAKRASQTAGTVAHDAFRRSAEGDTTTVTSRKLAASPFQLPPTSDGVETGSGSATQVRDLALVEGLCEP